MSWTVTIPCNLCLADAGALHIDKPANRNNRDQPDREWDASQMTGTEGEGARKESAYFHGCHSRGHVVSDFGTDRRFINARPSGLFYPSLLFYFTDKDMAMLTR
jgi:hypothetical protein